MEEMNVAFECVGVDQNGCPNSLRKQNIWGSKPLPLQLDHVSGDVLDDRPENLRWLCPNCHSQTETYCAKNISDEAKQKKRENYKSSISKYPFDKFNFNKTNVDWNITHSLIFEFLLFKCFSSDVNILLTVNKLLTV